MFVDPMKKGHGIAWELAYLLELLEEDKRQKSVPNSSWKYILAVKKNFWIWRAEEWTTAR